MSSTPVEGGNDAQDDASKVADGLELSEVEQPTAVVSGDGQVMEEQILEGGDWPSLADEGDEGGEGDQVHRGARDGPDLAADAEAIADAADDPIERPEESNADTNSIPDDTPSVQDSALSSPRSRSILLQSPASRKSLSGTHRPFEWRFQSRLSSSQLLNSPRPSSPAFMNAHSRQSSLASIVYQPSTDPDDSTAPWDVIRWNKMRKLTSQAFSEIGRRNFGRPTSLAVTDHIVIGTSKGLVLIFDFQETPRAIIGSGTQAVECGAITSLAISADHTTVAAGHATGHIFTWEIAKSARPFLHIPPIDFTQPQTRKLDGHLSGCAVLHIGFLGIRHTALVSADDRGMAFSHLATRGMGAVGRTVRTTRILGRYPDLITRSLKPRKQSSVLAFSPLPLGNVEQTTDTLGLVAMMTPYLLVIVSTTPVAQTQHKAARPKEVAAHSAMSAALAWFPPIKLKAKDSEVSKTKLVYCWSNVLTVLEVHEIPPEDDAAKEKPPDLQFVPRSRYKAEEAIVGVQWISRSVLAVLTITQQLLILEDVSMNVTDSFDLLQKNVYHADLYSQQLQSVVEQLDEEDSSLHGVVADAFHMSFRAYKGRLYLLGFNDLSWGSLTNWADRLLAMIEAGDFIGAIKLATTYHAGLGEKVTIGLPEDDAARSTLVQEKLLEIMSASLKYAFGRNQKAGNQQIEKPQLADLALACVAACVTIDDQAFLFDEVFSWFEDHDQAAIFLDVLEPYFSDGQVTSLPPTVIKALFQHFSRSRPSTEFEELICLLDTSTMDIDQVTSLCKKHNLFDAYIYVWNKALGDYTGPLEDLLKLAVDLRGMNDEDVETSPQYDTAQKIFPYLSFVLTSRTYPTGVLMEEAEAVRAKNQVYEFFFSGSLLERTSLNPTSSSHPGVTLPFSHLREILSFDTASFMSVLNEAFEDSFLNTGTELSINGTSTHTEADHGVKSNAINRQFIVRIMLEIMPSSGFDPEDTIYLDIFIARNLPKYPQYILLSGSTLHDILIRLCQSPLEEMRDDIQLSVEYLMSVYHPPDVLSLVSTFRSAGFYRVLKSVFRQENQYRELLNAYFADSDDKEGVFPSIIDCLKPQSGLSARERREVIDVIKVHARDLTQIDVVKTAMTMDQIAPDLHKTLLAARKDDPKVEFQYLGVLMEPSDEEQSRSKTDSTLVERYLQLMCQYNPAHVADFVDALKVGDLRLQEVLPAMEASGVVDAAVILLAREGQVKDAMDRLVAHLESLKAALAGILHNVQESPDVVTTNEAITDLLESIEKYAVVGIWLCQGQSKSATKSRPTVKSPKRSSSSRETLSFEENMWLHLIDVVVAIARDLSSGFTTSGGDTEDDEITSSLRIVIQRVFTALLTITTSSRESSKDRSDVSFLRILRAFLSHAAKSSPSLTELRAVIASIFSAYAYEESLLELANSMLDKDLFIKIDDISKMRQRGWRPRGQICEICRRRVWGPGLGSQVWTAWQKNEHERSQRRLWKHSISQKDEGEGSRGKGKAAEEVTPHLVEEEVTADPNDLAQEELGAIIVFSCRHLYHQRCLGSPQVGDCGSGEDTTTPGHLERACPLCTGRNK